MVRTKVTAWLLSMEGKFRPWFWRASDQSFSMGVLPSGLEDVISDGEELCRFLTQSNQFNTTMVKPSAFLPSTTSLETSVFRHGAKPEDQLWTIGTGALVGRPFYGAAIFRPSATHEAGLTLAVSEPPHRHAAIRGWPRFEHDPVLTKAQQKEKATIIASQCDLLLRT